MQSDTRNVKLGVCSVTYDGVDLGYTKGGVEVEVTTETHRVEVDQFGKSPINEIIMGRNVMAKVPLAETTLENMARIMPGATLHTVGGVKATGTIIFSVAAPSVNDTVTVNGVVFTFKAAATPSTNEVAHGASHTAAAANLAAKLEASTDPLVSCASYSVVSGTITVLYDTEGVAGNAFTLAKSGTNIAVSGAVLTTGADPTAKKVTVENGIGISLLDIAQKLVLHPVANDAEDTTEDFVIPLAATAGALQFAYKLDDERIYNVTFTGYPDPDTQVLFVVGDELAVES